LTQDIKGKQLTVNFYVLNSTRIYVFTFMWIPIGCWSLKSWGGGWWWWGLHAVKSGAPYIYKFETLNKHINICVCYISFLIT